jgi:diguanylate cyclase (GGDEF)-like protein
LYLDIDNFSQISRKDGFIISDRFLEEFVINIKTFIENQNIYDSIFFARIGNDEFAMIIKDQSLERVIQFVEKLIEFSKRTYRIYNKEYYLSLSVGISIFPDDAKTPEELLRLAEIAFRRSKEEKGDGNYAFLTREIEKDIVEKVQLESILQTNVFMLQTKDKAKIQQTGFKLEYQPIFDLEKEKVVFLEALLRWEHPTLGKISPIKFIPVAEKNRLIIPLGYFVIEEVIKQIISWQENDIPVVPIGINISYVQLQKFEFIEVLRKLLKEYRIDPSLIEFEITENSFLQDNEITKKILNELKEMSIKLLIDDFGIGYSSLSYLLKYKFDAIKIDQFFVKSLTENHHKDSDALKLIRTIIQISKNLNIHTIAEGIETKEQMEILLKEGCKWGQGYYLSYPLSSKEIEKLLYEKSKH